MQPQNIGYYILNEAADPEIIDNLKILSPNKSDRIIAEGTLQRTGSKNRNGRTYLKTDLEPELSAPRQKELFKARQMKGEMGHPDPGQGGLGRQQTIDPKLTCVEFLDKFWMEGDLVKGRFKGTNNDLGQYFDLDLREGAKPAFSLRALGSIESRGGVSYVKNLKLITYDQVIFPSHPEAYTSHIVKGATESSFVKESSNILVTEGGIITPLTQGKIIEYVKEESNNLKQVIDTLELVYETVKLNDTLNQVILKHVNGDSFVVNLENYIKDDIMNYCFKK